jgi:ligand-binding SRPBCC domain-containing protein
VTVRLEIVTHIDAPIGVVFDAARDIDLHVASMAESGERAVAGTVTGLIGLGESVTWTARHFGVPFTMTSEITELDPPRHFVDAQVSGPFRTFRHVHQFSEREGTTRMVDLITFDAPMGPIGRLAERLVLRSYLTHLIEARNEHLRTHAEAH